MRFIYKTLLDEKEKKEERDGMQMQRESGRNASSLGWHVLRNSRSINHGRAVRGYIVRGGVSESIHSDCFKKKSTRKRMNLLIKCL
jgi:predicted amino acid racemase